jgi:uncharacterized membrane protein YkoI
MMQKLLLFIGLISAGIILVLGGSTLWETLARPTAPPDEVRVLDEKPLAPAFDLSGTETVTLLTVVEPAADFDLDLPPALPGGIAVDEALRIATELNPGGVVTEIRLQRERRVLVYRVDFDDRMRALIDADSGQVLEINPHGSDDDERRVLTQGIASETGMLDAIALAVERYPGTIFEEAELDERDDRLVYIIELDNGLEVTIDANTGAYLYTELDGERWVGEPPFAESASISFEEALQTARDLFPDATVDEWELTTEEGRLVYDIELDNGVAVYVDATTGTVVEVERE